MCTAKYSNICCTLESSIGWQFGQDAWIYVSTHHYLSPTGILYSGILQILYSRHC